MSFTPRACTLRGGFAVRGPVETVFPLFSPDGERKWVPGWDPEILHPPTGWEQGQIFRTREERGDAVWVITRLDRARHEVEYHRVEPGRYVAHIEVRCHAVSDRETEVTTAYSFIGLAAAGNEDIAAMTQAAYDAKMSRWAEWIELSLRPGQASDA
jgi:hypothetical protein